MTTAASLGLLGDTAERDYGRKLRLFTAFAAAELRALIACLALRPTMRALDAGCGAGLATAWLAEALGPHGLALGLDLATAHTRLARAAVPAHVGVLQADMAAPPLRPYLAPDDWDALAALCDSASPAFCLRRPDFHSIQTFTLVTGAR